MPFNCQDYYARRWWLGLQRLRVDALYQSSAAGSQSSADHRDRSDDDCGEGYGTRTKVSAALAPMDEVRAETGGGGGGDGGATAVLPGAERRSRSGQPLAPLAPVTRTTCAATTATQAVPLTQRVQTKLTRAPTAVRGDLYVGA